jgi:Bacterial dnaA protein helix-turn-helix
MSAAPEITQTARDFHLARLARLKRMHAKAVPDPLASLLRVQKQQHIGRAIIYAAPIGPRLPTWHPMARMIYSYRIGPHHIMVLNTPPSRKTTALQIVRWTAEKHGVAVKDMLSERRYKKFADARFEAIGRIFTETNLSMVQIGRVMGGRDHTTILHALRKLGLRQRQDSQP